MSGNSSVECSNRVTNEAAEDRINDFKNTYCWCQGDKLTINPESSVDNLEYTNTNTTDTNTIPTDQSLHMKYPIIHTTVTVIHWTFP